MKRLLQIALLGVGLFILSYSYAIPVFNITTNDKTIFVLPGGDATITYTVQNVSGINMPQMRYFPPATTTISSSAGTCNNFLASGASCIVQLIFHAPKNVTGVLPLNPLGVCGFQGRACSVPNALNHTTAIIIPPPPPPSIIYVVNRASSDVSVINSGTDTLTTTIPVGTVPGSIAITPTGLKAYVANSTSNSVSVIDTLTNTVSTTIALPRPPTSVIIMSNGTRAYVTTVGATPGQVTIIDIASDTIVTSFNVGTGPITTVFTPNNLKAYVPNNLSFNISVIDTSTNTVTATIPLGGTTGLPAILSNGTKLYAPSISGNNVKVINVTTDTVIATIALGAGTGPRMVAITPNNAKAYIVNSIGNSVSVICTGVVPTVCAATDTLLTTIALDGTLPFFIAITPDGTKAYVTDTGNGRVSVIDTSTDTLTASSPITVGTAPQAEAILPDGTKLYVGNRTSNTVSVIDIATDTVITTIPVGTQPFAIAIRP